MLLLITITIDFTISYRITTNAACPVHYTSQLETFEYEFLDDA